MAFAAKVQSLVWDEAVNDWVDSGQIIITKNSVSGVKEPVGAAGKTAIRLNDGSTLRVNQTMDQILTFLNGA